MMCVERAPKFSCPGIVSLILLCPSSFAIFTWIPREIGKSVSLLGKEKHAEGMGTAYLTWVKCHLVLFLPSEDTQVLEPYGLACHPSTVELWATYLNLIFSLLMYRLEFYCKP